MADLVALRPELEEQVEILDREPSNAAGKARLLLRLVLANLLLGEPADRWREEQSAVARGIDPQDPSLEPRHLLQLATAQALLGESFEDALAATRERLPAAIEAAGNHDYSLAVTGGAALGAALLGGEAAEVERRFEARLATPPVKESDGHGLETLTAARRWLASSATRPAALRWEASHVANGAFFDGANFMAPEAAAVAALIVQAGESPSDLLAGGLAAIDADLFPDGPEADPRVEVGEPAWALVRSDDEPQALEVRVAIAGQGGRLHALGPLLGPLIYGLPAAFIALASGKRPGAAVRGARSAAELLRVVGDRDGLLAVVVELDGDLEIDPSDAASYQERVETAALWARAQVPAFRCRTELRVEASTDA